MTVHASVELLEAMRGEAPPDGPMKLESSRIACGLPNSAQYCIIGAYVVGPSRRPAFNTTKVEPSEHVDCPDCIRLYPDEIRMRMDYVAIREAS